MSGDGLRPQLNGNATSLLQEWHRDDDNPWERQRQRSGGGGPVRAAFRLADGGSTGGGGGSPDDHRYVTVHAPQQIGHDDGDEDGRNLVLQCCCSKCMTRLLIVTDLLCGGLLLACGIRDVRSDRDDPQQPHSGEDNLRLTNDVLVLVWSSLLLSRGSFAALSRIRLRDEDWDDLYGDVRAWMKRFHVRVVTACLAVHCTIIAIWIMSTPATTCSLIRTTFQWLFRWLAPNLAETVQGWICREHHYYVTYTAFLVLAVLECIRYKLGVMTLPPNRRNSVGGVGGEDGDQQSQQQQQPQQQHRRPWWWQSHTSQSQLGDNNFATDELRENLLRERNKSNNSGLPDWVTEGRRTYHERSGITPPRRRWGAGRSGNENSDNAAAATTTTNTQRPRGGGGWTMFGGWLFGGGNHNANGGDDDSLRRNDEDGSFADFASVQEEWASRTEEDPFWWSRENDGNGANAEDDPIRGTPRWAVDDAAADHTRGANGNNQRDSTDATGTAAPATTTTATTTTATAPSDDVVSIEY